MSAAEKIERDLKSTMKVHSDEEVQSLRIEVKSFLDRLTHHDFDFERQRQARLIS